MAKKASTPKPAADKPVSTQSTAPKKTAVPKATKPATAKTTEKPTKASTSKVPKYSQGGVIGETRSDAGPGSIKSRGTGPDVEKSE